MPDKTVVEVVVKDACTGSPPKGAKLATCNTKTGLWEDAYVALDKKIYDKHVNGTPETETVVEADGTVDTVVVDEPATDLEVIDGEVVEVAAKKEPKTEPVVTDDGQVVEVPVAETEKAVTKDGAIIDVPVQKTVEVTETMITDDGKVVEVPTGEVEVTAPAVEAGVATQTAVTADGVAVEVPAVSTEVVPIEAIADLAPTVEADGTKIATAIADDGTQY